MLCNVTWIRPTAQCRCGQVGCLDGSMILTVRAKMMMMMMTVFWLYTGWLFFTPFREVYALAISMEIYCWALASTCMESTTRTVSFHHSLLQLYSSVIPSVFLNAFHLWESLAFVKVCQSLTMYRFLCNDLRETKKDRWWNYREHIKLCFVQTWEWLDVECISYTGEYKGQTKPGDKLLVTRQLNSKQGGYWPPLKIEEVSWKHWIMPAKIWNEWLSIFRYRLTGELSWIKGFQVVYFAVVFLQRAL